MFGKQVEEPPEFTVTEFLALDIRLNEMIGLWVKKEIGSGVRPNTKLAEVAIFNFKMIYSSQIQGIELRQFLKKAENIEQEKDYIFSRIQDLYLIIMMSFPKHFVEFVRRKHVESLVELGYDVSEDIVTSYPFGWLFPRIQHALRYAMKINRD